MFAKIFINIYQEIIIMIIIIIIIIIVIIIIITTREHASSLQVTSPLVEHIVAQTHQLPDESLIESGRLAVKRGRAEELSGTAENLKQIVPRKTKRALDLAQEKGSSVWLTVRPRQEQGFNLSKREFRDAVKLCYDWPFDDIPSICACGENFTVDHAMICK